MRTKFALKKTGLPAKWHVVGTADNGEVSTSSVGYTQWAEGFKALSQAVRVTAK